MRKANQSFLCQFSTGRGAEGAWQRFERGELKLTPFYQAFSRELSDATTNNRFYTAYCKRRGIGEQFLSLDI
jgi:hypothetical protein